MAVVIILLAIIAMAVAPQAILNVCAFLDWLLGLLIRGAVFIGTIGFFVYLASG